MAKRKNIVIVGAGFGGLAAAQALAEAHADITVIDRRNFHLFQPLLYQVATAALSPADISAPIRSVLRRQANAHVMLDKVTGIDREKRVVLTEGRRAVPFDYLVLATGARHSYFGRDDWAPFAPGIKTLDDATRLRARILLAFERAELETDPAARRALLTFVVIGAGPTGVELAGSIAELARKSVTRDFRSIAPGDMTVVLIEAGPRILPSFRENLAQAAAQSLEEMGVTLRLAQPVTEVTAHTVTISGRVLPAATIIWAAGVKASAAGRWLGAETDRAGRVKVGPDFTTAGEPDIFVIGDTAACVDEGGKALPGVAPAAKQAGAWVGKLIAARLASTREPKPFRYRDKGAMATIGRKSAVVDLGRIRLTGGAGWLLWSAAHVWFLIGFRNRFSVATSWLWSYLTWERGARLITGQEIARARAPDIPIRQQDAA
ncbi:NAD(P)/FAD-dependent oxidoreductase [Bosea psychrotolerans]|uniref:NAD(P)/FAD-dependent oxidoreductase n=1 Tax=Bosea psychrotolerans TaxID=1871628 RepID=UPI0015E1A4F3|nr:NAD(P)/FAD-dependent oxidoreductase [Bosea psychrotolerans]